MDFFRKSFLAFSAILILGGCYKPADISKEDKSVVQISPLDLKVGEETVITITVTAPEKGINVDGGLHLPFYMKPWNGLIKGISEDKKSNTLITASRSDGGSVEAINILTNPDWDILSDLNVLVRGTPLPDGESITIQIGNDAQKVVVGRKQLSFFLEIELDVEGDGNFLKLIPPHFPIEESEPVELHLVAPSYIRMDEEFEVIAYAEDGFQNVCEAYEGQLDISLSGNKNEDQITYQMRKWDKSKDLDRNAFSYIIEDPGIYYLEAVDQDNELNAISNPIMVTEKVPDKNLYWGEVHVHSQLSDGRGELQDVYRDGYARGLDFVAITDHGFGRNARGSLEERIQDICKEADRFNRPGEFVAIPAGETHYFPVMHMNMFFDEADLDDILSLVNSINEITSELEKNWKNMSADQLSASVVPYWDIFKSEVYDKHTLAFPHHTMWLGIKPFLDAERTRVIEIYSVHGTSEIRDQKNTPKPLQMKPDRIKGDPDQKFSAREALNEGIRLGFVGGSDSHEGQAGYNAITGLYAHELTRSSVIKGIYDKECYGNSSNRTLIMLQSNETGYACTVAGDGELDLVQVIHNGEVVYAPDQIEGRICSFNWIPPQPKAGYFYVKAILEEGHEAAWSSPVWFDELKE